MSRMRCGVMVALILGFGTLPLVHAEEMAVTVERASAGHILKTKEQGLLVLYGVESPSTTQLIGAQARQFTDKLVQDRPIKVHLVENKFGMTLIRIELPDGADLAEALLSAGLAQWDRATAPKDARLRDLEDRARKRGVGLWLNQETPPTKQDNRPKATKTLELHGDPELAEQAKREWEEMQRRRAQPPTMTWPTSSAGGLRSISTSISALGGMSIESVAGVEGYVSLGQPAASQIVAKKCSVCGSSAPVTAERGAQCLSCGVTWEQQVCWSGVKITGSPAVPTLEVQMKREGVAPSKETIPNQKGGAGANAAPKAPGSAPGRP